jgi:4-hydroxybenzoate polyprenyltransferase
MYRNHGRGQALPLQLSNGAARDYFAALRPRQWAKNLLVLAPLVFSQRLFAREPLVAALTAFALFCLASSAGYLANDLRDLRHDRAHPSKRLRPIASGRVGVRSAAALAVLLFAAALGGALVLLGRDFALALGAYCALTLLYTFLLKRVVLVDVFAVAAGFVLRAASGALAVGVESSGWLLICTTLLALLVGFGKRRSELMLLKAGAGGHRRVLEDYDERLLDMLIATSAASAVMSYALYTESAETVGRLGTRWLFATFPFVVYGLFRYLYLLYAAGRGGDPVETALGDRPMLLNALLWAATVVAVLYFR